MTVNLRKPTTTRDLTVCPGCDRDMVSPVSWFEASPTHWSVRLRCGNCGRMEWGNFDQATVDAFDKRLDALLERMHVELLERSIERFARALRLGLLLPEDF